MDDQTLIEQLLFEEEGNALDFKSKQYRFSHGTDEEKSELLKDILAFANAWRRIEAYILIGVEEVKGGRSKVVGISDHLDDANIQQFLDSKTQRPIEFSYKTIQFENVQIGIIKIPIQRRPFYLKKDFGLLKKSQVYIRRGSSTAIASPDEISTMGEETISAYREMPLLEAFLVFGQNDEIIEKKINCKLINATIPADNVFPDYKIPTANSWPDSIIASVRSPKNKNYYRDKAKYLKAHFCIEGFKLMVKNSGGISARDVKMIFNLVNDGGTSIACEYDSLPQKPASYRSDFHLAPNDFNHDVYVKTIPNGWHITCFFGKIQPKDIAITTDRLYLGALVSKSIFLNGQIFSDDLPTPKDETLEIICEVEDQVFSVGDFLKKEET